jgi:hypothetical protein
MNTFAATALELIRAQRLATLDGDRLGAKPRLRQILRGGRNLFMLATAPGTVPASRPPQYGDLDAILLAYLDELAEAENGDSASHGVADELLTMLGGQRPVEGSGSQRFAVLAKKIVAHAENSKAGAPTVADYGEFANLAGKMPRDDQQRFKERLLGVRGDGAGYKAMLADAIRGMVTRKLLPTDER